MLIVVSISSLFVLLFVHSCACRPLYLWCIVVWCIMLVLYSWYSWCWGWMSLYVHIRTERTITTLYMMAEKSMGRCVVRWLSTRRAFWFDVSQDVFGLDDLELFAMRQPMMMVGSCRWPAYLKLKQYFISGRLLYYVKIKHEPGRSCLLQALQSTHICWHHNFAAGGWCW